MKRLVLVGGGHAHLTILKNLGSFVGKGHPVTLISPSPYHYYSGMGPGLLSGIYRPQQARFHIGKMAIDRGGSFLEGKVVHVDAKRRRLALDRGGEIPYDVVSFNTGSKVPMRGISGEEKLYPVKPIENLLSARKAIIERLRTESIRFAVVGGGPAGLELAGNLWRLVRQRKGSAKITLLAGRKFLPDLPDRARSIAGESLRRRGVEIVEGSNVDRMESAQARLEDGRRFAADFFLLAWGIEPSPIFRESGLPVGNGGGLLVNEFLQSVEFAEIFGGGDCIDFQEKNLDKVGVYPVRENPVLCHNVSAALSGGRLKPFKPQKSYLLIFNLGDGKAIFWKDNWTFHGRLPYYLKDSIDRKFMKRFQLSGELEERESPNRR